MNFFSRFKKIAAISYGGVIISAALLFSSLYQESSVYITKALKFQLIEQTQALNFLLRVRADAVRSLKIQAEDFLKEPPNPNFRPPLEYYPEKQIFGLRRDVVNKSKMGNLTGLSSLKEIDASMWHELTMAYHLNPLLRVIKTNTQTITMAYYISNRNFSNIFPWKSPKKSYFCAQEFKHNLCTRIIEEGADKDGLFWTDLYLSPENVLMMTCAAPVYEDQIFRGVVAIDFTLGALSHFFNNIHHNFGRLFVLNEQNSILEDTGYYSDVIENNIKLNVEHTLPKSLDLNRIKEAQPNVMKRVGDYWVFRSPLTYAPWTVVYYVHVWEIAFAALRNIGPGFILIFVFATIILIAANRLIIQEFIYPTQKLVSHITNQGRQPLDYADLKEPWYSWFDAVSNVFKQNRELVGALEEHIEDLDQIVSKRTKDLSKRNRQLQGAITNLQKAQSKIILQEKMAGLGALTAGIAHEIKNPLNFIINFSINSRDFLDELKTYLLESSTHIPQQKLESIEQLLHDLDVNLSKIQKHGNHADLIIHSMLVHARGGSDEPQLSHINDVIEENIMLVLSSFKQKGFTPHIERSYDTRIPKMRMFPQDIGRVFLNMVTNAFDALLEKKKVLKDFHPILQITTKLLNHNQLEIRIYDNGPGISEKFQKKIFDPFFTTKPAGRGTGLGLSLSYDIITRQHHGTITLKSKEEEFSEFIITLPLEKSKLAKETRADTKHK